jgi:hypothetical protein
MLRKFGLGLGVGLGGIFFVFIFFKTLVRSDIHYVIRCQRFENPMANWQTDVGGGCCGVMKKDECHCSESRSKSKQEKRKEIGK